METTSEIQGGFNVNTCTFLLVREDATCLAIVLSCDPVTTSRLLVDKKCRKVIKRMSGGSPADRPYT